MTTTDELRRLLDERGVEWRKPAQEYWVLLGMPEGDSTTIVGELSIEEATDGTLVAYNLTPAQAIAATLGESMTDTEKAALERRIDELCAEVERLRKAKDTMHGDAFEIGAMLVKARDENAKLRADQAHWELGNCPSCPNVVSLQEALEQNAKLRELVDELYPLADYGAMNESELDRAHDLMRELGVDA